MPFDVTVDPPPLVTFPPDTAPVEVIEDADVVVTVGIETESVVKLIWFP